jgi:O-antigen ligase
MEYGIYLLAIFLFTDMGTSFRSLGTYVPPLALVIRIYLTRVPPFNWKTPLFLCVVALCTSAILSAAVSDETVPFLIWIKKRYLKAFLIFVVVTAAFKERNTLKKLLLLLSIISLPFIVMTYNDYITKALSENGVILFDKVRDYNSILSFLLPLIPFAYLTAKSRMLKAFWALSLCIGFTALLLTGFRTGWVSFIVSMAVWAAWFSTKRSKKSIVLAIAGFLLIGFIALSFLPSSHIVMRIKQGFSTTERYEWIWKPYISMYGEFPVTDKVLGKGMADETMYNYHSLYRDTLDYDHNKNVPLSPHNQYLNILFRQGMLGLALYMILIAIFLMSMITVIRQRISFEDKAMGIAILALFVGQYIVSGLVSDLRFMPMGLTLGMAGAYLQNKKDSNDNSPVRKSTGNQSHRVL